MILPRQAREKLRGVVSQCPASKLDVVAVRVVQLRRGLRRAAVQAIEIKRRGAKVCRPPWEAVFQQRGFQVQRDVVIQELAEERHARRHGGIVRTGDRRVQNRLNGIDENIQGIDRAAFYAELPGLFTRLVGLEVNGGRVGNIRVKESSGRWGCVGLMT